MRFPSRLSEVPFLAKTLAVVVTASSLAAAMGLASCADAPTENPLRTFERAQKLDTICLKVNDAAGNPVVNSPLPLEACAPVPVGVDGSFYPNHLFALVTQTARGEVGVVDLTARKVVDIDHGTPGTNFIPVGVLPTGIASSPKSDITYVVTAEPNKPGLYALPSKVILGDSQGLPNTRVPTIATLPVCALPGRPAAIELVPHKPDGADDPGYDIVVVFGGSRLEPARIVVYDAKPFLRGAGVDASVGTTITPGTFNACIRKNELAVSGAYAADTKNGGAWPTGVPYADASDLRDALPANIGPGCGPAPAPSDAGATDSGASDAGANDGGSDSGAPTLQGIPRLGDTTRDGTMLFVADEALPIVHVIDFSSGTPVELAPYEMGSALDPSRKPVVSSVAISPTTRDYKRYLYAVDRTTGTIAVFDATDAKSSNRFPLHRPYPELDPFQQPDRIGFASPVTSVTFARHDVALRSDRSAAPTGVLCNPNPNANESNEPGARYRANASNRDDGFDLGPTRLRGVFGFATLTNGQVATIDVDDWDSPCRRPNELRSFSSGVTLPASAISSPQDLVFDPQGRDPYQAPLAATDSVTAEAFYPVSAPHTPRSVFLLRNDPGVSGNRIPHLTNRPSVQRGNTPLATNGAEGEKNVIMLPTRTTVADPNFDSVAATVSENVTRPGRDEALPGVRFSYETPDVHVDQDWAVTYESTLPNFPGIVGTMSSSDGYKSLTVSQPEAFFCRRGVEDSHVGRARAQAAQAELVAAGLPPIERLDEKVLDYLEVSDDVLGVGDPYWREPNSCWEGDLADNNRSTDRHDYCEQLFGPKDAPNLERDFPIADAFQDRLVLGRFAFIAGKERSIHNRVMVANSESNQTRLKALQCCFHNQMHFNVRTGSQWFAQGSVHGYLHHITADDRGACVSSCDPRDVLLNARTIAVPRPLATGVFVAPTRDSALALRNPAFSFVIYNGFDKVDVPPTRDMVWKFQTAGQFSILSVNFALTSTAVSLQSMRYIGPLGVLAVVDGSLQGLSLIDLNNMSFSGSPLL